MNFDKIFFQLLIIKTLYQYGLGGQAILVAPVKEISVLSDNPISKYTTAQIAQFEGEDRFCIVDENISLFVMKFAGDFPSKSIEFCSLYDLEMVFLYRRSDDQILWFKCVFSEKDFIQEFFKKIYSFKPKDDPGVIIFKIARYFNATQQIEAYVKHANLYSKDTTSLSKGYVQKIYFITHIADDTIGTTEVDFIFHAKGFAISDIYKHDKIALCIDAIPDIRILISFSGQMAGQRFVTDHMPMNMQHDNLVCEFPQNLTLTQVHHFLDEF